MKQVNKVVNLVKHVHEKGHVCLCKSNTWMPTTEFYNRGLNFNILQTEGSNNRYWRPINKIKSRYNQLHFSSAVMDNTEYAFEMASSSVRFGNGVTAEVGEDIKEMGLKKVILFTDKGLVNMRPVQVAEESLKRSGIKYVIYDSVRVEPSDKSFKDAINFAMSDNYDGFIAVGGGSVMDTAKAANLYSTYPVDDFLDYVNPPIGKGLPPPGPLKPLICIPTTAGTGSETTGVAIFDYEETKSKTGIAHRRLKPTLGIVDPENTYSLPPYVTAASGFDVLSHSLESYTALNFSQRRPRPERPILRPAYQGSNPISDVWSLKSLELCAKWLPIAVEEPLNKEARFQMMLAATYAGIGFGNAGVHLCHGLSYPVASQVKSYQATDYPTYKPLIPHGMSVIINAPSVFSFTGISAPERHRTAAKVMGADVDNVKDEVVGDILAEQIIKMMSRFKFPGSLRELGFNEGDIDGLVEATLPQKRVTVLSPRRAEAPELKSILTRSLKGYY